MVNLEASKQQKETFKNCSHAVTIFHAHNGTLGWLLAAWLHWKFFQKMQSLNLPNFASHFNLLAAECFCGQSHTSEWCSFAALCFHSVCECEQFKKLEKVTPQHQIPCTNNANWNWQLFREKLAFCCMNATIHFHLQKLEKLLAFAKINRACTSTACKQFNFGKSHIFQIKIIEIWMCLHFVLHISKVAKMMKLNGECVAVPSDSTGDATVQETISVHSKNVAPVGSFSAH